MRINRHVGGLALVALILALAAPLAFGAAQITRESYVAAVEPICKQNTKADERILQGVRQEVSHDELKPAAAQFAKAAVALAQTRRELAAVPRPQADEARLTKWLGYIEGEVELFEATAKKLRAGDRGGAERMSVQLTQEANRANLEVLPFEFRYCHAEPARFT